MFDKMMEYFLILLLQTIVFLVLHYNLIEIDKRLLVAETKIDMTLVKMIS
jgi:hypothetical protein